jgi:hypothetical protein
MKGIVSTLIAKYFYVLVVQRPCFERQQFPGSLD